MSSSATTWIVIAAFNEEPRLADTLRSVCSRGYEVVVVDDGSSDRSGEVIASYPVWRLRHVINRGQGASLQTGIDFVLQREGRFVVTFDGDGQHSADDIERLVEPLRRGQADVVLGSRFLGKAVGLPRMRRLVLKAGALCTRVFSGVRVTDAHNGLRALSWAAAERIRLRQDRMAHASEILEQIRVHGLRYCEVPVTIRYSASTLRKGQSSWSALEILGQLLTGKVVR